MYETGFLEINIQSVFLTTFEIRASTIAYHALNQSFNIKAPWLYIWALKELRENFENAIARVRFLQIRNSIKSLRNSTDFVFHITENNLNIFNYRVLLLLFSFVVSI